MADKDDNFLSRWSRRKVAVKREPELLRNLFEDTVGKALFSERLRLDGAIAVWHPSLWQ